MSNNHLQVWNTLSKKDIGEIKEHISPLIVPSVDSDCIRQFDQLMYAIVLAKLKGSESQELICEVMMKVKMLSQLDTIPQVMEQKDLIDRIQVKSFWEEANALEVDAVRKALRGIIKFTENG